MKCFHMHKKHLVINLCHFPTKMKHQCRYLSGRYVTTVYVVYLSSKSTGTKSSTTDTFIGPPPVTSYCIIIVKWPSENLLEE